MRIRYVVAGLLFSASCLSLAIVASASVMAPQKLITISDSHMRWTSCGKNCAQGIDRIDAISAVVRNNTLVVGELLRHSDAKIVLKENSDVLSAVVGGYGGQKASVWAINEMKAGLNSPAPFQATKNFNGNTLTLGGWAGDGSIAMSVVFH